MTTPTLASNARADRRFAVFNAVVSLGALSFIAYVLLRGRAAEGAAELSFMPAVNATLNAIAATLLVAGWLAIRRGAVHVHRALMVSAFAVSTVFVIGYLYYHSVHGDTRYTGGGALRVVYFVVLITHILLSMVVVPGALTSFYFAYTRAFDRHRRLNRIFLPIWLYVSVTGVLIFFLLRAHS
jgi:putative membrane protein